MAIQYKQNNIVNKTWIEPEDLNIPVDFQQAVGGIPLLAQMLYRLGIRDIATAQGFLDENIYKPASPTQLPDIQKSTDFLLDAIQQKKKISVWGDFDVDGQTSTTILVDTLRQLGAIVDFHIPVRDSESHGLNLPILEKMIDQGTQILITCDTGITSLPEVVYAQGRGVPVIITDHHDLPSELPKAFAVINPKLLPINHPLSSLPGVGVAYQLVKQLCYRSGKPDLEQDYLDLVALGIVADLALIKGDTRWLLQQGLRALRQTKRLGLQAIYKMLEINPENITEEHVGFYLAPRLNALGRLTDANRIVEFLTTTDQGKARLMAVELEGLNAQRKLTTDQVFQAAQNQLQANPKQFEDGIILLSNPTWPAGVIGIVASRLVERYNLPAILLSTPPGQVARGSARSVEGLNIAALISANQNYLVGFGGHPMAAGLSLEADNIPEFHRSLVRTIHQMHGTKTTIATLEINDYFPLTDLTLELVDHLERLSPFGPGNPPPILATRRLNLGGYSVVGRNAEHLILTVEDESDFEQKVIWWHGVGWPLPQGLFDMAYTVRASTYRGQRDLQVEWIDYRPVDEQPIMLEAPQRQIQIIDCRQETDPISILEPLIKEESTQIWCEALSIQPLPCLDRHQLSAPCATLAICTIPPGPVELHAVLEKTAPDKVYLFGINPNLDQPEAFLKRLAGLVKYAIKIKSGIVKLSELAATSSHRIRTIRAGIIWLEAHGYISVSEQDGDKLIVQPGTNSSTNNAYPATHQLKALLDETNAFRTYYLTADPDTLINL